MKLAIIFGGKSTEHDVSIVSGTSVLSHLNKSKYDIYPVYIDKDGKFFEYNPTSYKMLAINETIKDIKEIDNIIDYLKKMDVIFPVLHGLYGEDGTIEGLFELIGIPYVGCHVLSSSLCMDKVYTKKILKSAGINVTKDMYIKNVNNKINYIDDTFNCKELSIDELDEIILEYLHYPVYIKPSNSGSSVGVHKVHNKEELISSLNDAFIYDEKVLIEEEIKGREVECAIIGNDTLEASPLGEVLKDEFYSYESKYVNSVKTEVPAKIDKKISDEVRSIAKKAYLACDCKGLSRVDFFIEEGTNKIYLNEINTLPGFTSISMYPSLMKQLGYNYENLLDKLIDLAIETKKDK